ncbi:unnamed protein product [Meloidogyne enterolobii]|uniref:Uncharacterized protein n=1 Tax=Meloidogyne enterolobii TaxID=390850 RepID=A0ACB0XXE1_MELEN
MLGHWLLERRSETLLEIYGQLRTVIVKGLNPSHKLAKDSWDFSNAILLTGLCQLSHRRLIVSIFCLNFSAGKKLGPILIPRCLFKFLKIFYFFQHKLRSSRIFWHSVSRIQLEKNPVLTWKFCQLLHKLIHDGHRKITEESVGHVSRLNQLGNFWQHLRSSGYGQANTCYCKLLVSRLQFHKKYPSIPGNLNLNQRQLDTLSSDINETYELAIDMLDQMDELLNLKATIMSIMDSMRWSSLVPQGQCLLAPLILVILDTSKFYDFLVKAHFKLHKSLPADTLVGHRERFYDLFRRTKKFYEETANLQYFKYLVQIPTLPSIAPNFQQASELEDYRAPQAYLHAGTTSENGDQSPPDSQSVCDEQISSIIDISLPQMDNISMMGDSIASSTLPPSTSNNAGAQPIFDPKDEIIARLRLDIDAERDVKEKLFEECKNRIEQYEARLLHMNQEIDLHKEAAEEKTKELEELRVLSTTLGQERQQTSEESKRKVDETEHKFAKLKGAYQQIREDHIKVFIIFLYFSDLVFRRLVLRRRADFLIIFKRFSSV